MYIFSLYINISIFLYIYVFDRIAYKAVLLQVKSHYVDILLLNHYYYYYHYHYHYHYYELASIGIGRSKTNR